MVVLVAAFGLASSAELARAETAAETTDPDLEIIGGTKVGTCNWPTVASVGNWGNCTGTLIHPRVVMTAAHCGPSSGTSFMFGEGAVSSGFSVRATKCEAGATGQSGVNTNRDWAYCVLEDDERLKALPIVPVLHTCEAEKYLKPGATIQAVGFGKTSGSGSDFGTKREVEISVSSVGNGTIDVGNSGKGLCNGDSGGPIFIHLVDGAHDYGWRVFGSTSGGDQSCPGPATFVNVSQHIKYITENEEFDVTPCEDDSGSWTGGAACQGFPTSPGTAGGSWPACNLGTATSEFIDPCGVGTGGTGTGGSGGLGGAGMGGSGGAGAAAGTGGAGTGGAGTGGLGGAAGDTGAGGGAGASGAGGIAGSGGAAGTGGLSGGGGMGAIGGAAGASGGAAGTAGTSGGSAGAGGTAGSAGASTGGSSSGWGTAPASDPGCACRTGRSAAPRFGVLSLVLLSLGARARRRRTEGIS